MNKIKLIINLLLNRIMNKKITHILMTVNGNKIKCYESVELYEGETKIVIAICRIGLKNQLVTINSENVEYILENYNNNSWNTILNISNINEEEIIEDRLYG